MTADQRAVRPRTVYRAAAGGPCWPPWSLPFTSAAPERGQDLRDHCGGLPPFRRASLTSSRPAAPLSADLLSRDGRTVGRVPRMTAVAHVRHRPHPVRGPGRDPGPSERRQRRPGRRCRRFRRSAGGRHPAHRSAVRRPVSRRTAVPPRRHRDPSCSDPKSCLPFCVATCRFQPICISTVVRWRARNGTWMRHAPGLPRRLPDRGDSRVPPRAGRPAFRPPAGLRFRGRLD